MSYNRYENRKLVWISIVNEYCNELKALMGNVPVPLKNKAIDFAGVIMKHPLTDEIWMRVNSKSNPISQISASIDSAITAVNDLKNIASKIK